MLFFMKVQAYYYYYLFLFLLFVVLRKVGTNTPI